MGGLGPLSLVTALCTSVALCTIATFCKLAIFEPSISDGRLTSKGEVKCANGKEEEAFKEELGLPRDKGRNEEPKAKKALGHTFSYLSKANVKEEAFVFHISYTFS
eukprot:Gb_19997 [translate_table: standard]